MMTQSQSVASVTVACNACHLLPRQIDALRQQSWKIDEIIVVDNASTDGTVDMLSQRYPEVTVLKLPENRGVGGGYAAGLSHAALVKRHDWVWLLDDDSVPPNNSLESLLVGFQPGGEAGTIAVLAPVCIDPKTSVSWPGLSWQEGRLVVKPFDPTEPLIFVDSVMSSGSLIRREAVEAVGLPRVDFFMDFVDHEYCLRLRRHGFRVAIVRTSILEHEVGGLTTVNLLGLKKSWSVHAPWREYYMARNETFTMWQYYPKLITKSHVLYRLTRHAIGILLFGKNRLACLAMQWRGFMDGRTGKLGVRFLPGN
jgi:GT2 family glycosyltransferase